VPRVVSSPASRLPDRQTAAAAAAVAAAPGCEARWCGTQQQSIGQPLMDSARALEQRYTASYLNPYAVDFGRLYTDATADCTVPRLIRTSCRRLPHTDHLRVRERDDGGTSAVDRSIRRQRAAVRRAPAACRWRRAMQPSAIS
jgi:hypothetical protein